MIDIHVHLLSATDDGPQTAAESLAMCRMAAADGITAAIATPHQQHPMWLNDDTDLLHSAFEELQNATDAPTLHLGAEIRITSELLDLLPEGEQRGGEGEINTPTSPRRVGLGPPTENPQTRDQRPLNADTPRVPQLKIQNSKLEIDNLISLAKSNYLLLEFSTTNTGLNPREIIHELIIAGWFPILAHPERIPWLVSDPHYLAELVNLGALLQLTAQSVTGEFGPRMQQVCEYLLDHDLAHFIASDGHNTTTRPPRLSVAYDVVAGRWGHDLATQLMIANPKAVIENRPVDIAG